MVTNPIIVRQIRPTMTTIVTSSMLFFTSLKSFYRTKKFLTLIPFCIFLTYASSNQIVKEMSNKIYEIQISSFGSAIILPHSPHLVTSNGSYIEIRT